MIKNKLLCKNITNEKQSKKSILQYMYLRRNMYLLMIPGIAYFIIFRYLPLVGNVIAFQDFNFSKGIFGSEWVGFENFTYLFKSNKFLLVLRNTIWISIIKLFWGFPAPIIIALLLNEIRNQYFKRSIQTIIYLPHFISWPIIGGLMVSILSPDHGIVNFIIEKLGGEPVFFLASKKHFRSILVISDIWKEVGWGTIIYLSTLSSINPELYEAAIVDGANRLRLLWHITLPGIKPTIIILLILRVGNILETGFDQIFILYNPSVYEVADVLDTYIYRIGLVSGKYGFSTAAGMFQSIIGFILIVLTNQLSKKLGEQTIF